jgi:ABC-type uncharacterized transport system involved in gliding motility auxiliary subunit
LTRPTLARILAVTGLLLAVTSPVTWLLGGGPLLAGKLLAAAAALVGALLLAGAGDARRFFTGRAAHFGLFTTASALLVAAVLAAANWAASAHPLSWDLTHERLHTLSDDTVRTLAGLPADVEALAFYRADEDAQAAARALLRRYADRSPRFRFRLVDPYASPELARLHEISDGGARIVLVSGERSARVAEPTEEALTNGLVELARDSSRKVYALGGHGEPGLAAGPGSAISAAVEGLRRDGFEVVPLSLVERLAVPADASAVLVVGPRKRLLEPEVKALEDYLSAGGRLGVYLEPGVDSGLDGLLGAWGVEADDDMVVDPGQASQLFGGSPVNPVGLPVPGHPVTARLENVTVVLPTARSLVALTTGGAARAQPLLLTTRDAWGETALADLARTGRAELSDGEKSGQLPLALATSRTAAAGGDARPGRQGRLLVVGDAEFMDDRYAQVLGNLDFFLNGVAWLGEQPDRIVIRHQRREGSRLVLGPGQVAAIRFVTLDAFPVLLLGLGLAVWQLRRSR